MKIVCLIFSSMLLMLLSSCNTDIQKIELDVFSESTANEEVLHKIEYSSYLGDALHSQTNTIYPYQSISLFSDMYDGEKFIQKTFENVHINYREFGLMCVRDSYMYFHIITLDGLQQIMKFDMETDTEEIIFTYDSDNQIMLCDVNDKYLVWREDENANWLKATLHYHEFAANESKTFFEYSRNPQTGLMFSWNFNNIIIDGDNIYFDNTEKFVDNVAYINMYKYNIKTETLEVIDQDKASKPLKYNGISWLGFDIENKEYVLKNSNKENAVIKLGTKYADIYASENIIVGHINDKIDGIMYYDGSRSIPICEFSYDIEGIHVTDSIIAWTGYNIYGSPYYFNVNEQKLIYVDCLNEAKKYTGYVTDEYLIYGVNEYIQAPDKAEGLVTTSTLIYYYIPVCELV